MRRMSLPYSLEVVDCHVAPPCKGLMYCIFEGVHYLNCSCLIINDSCEIGQWLTELVQICHHIRHCEMTVFLWTLDWGRGYSDTTWSARLMSLPAWGFWNPLEENKRTFRQRRRERVPLVKRICHKLSTMPTILLLYTPLIGSGFVWEEFRELI